MNSEKNCKKNCGAKCASTFGCVLAGMASGIVLGAIGKLLLDKNKKALKKKADKLMDAMNELGASAMEMFR